LPVTRGGVLAVEYAVEDVDLLMRNYYVLRDLQVAIVHGPGRRPASQQLFLTFAGPTDVLFCFVAESAVVAAQRRPPLQFPPRHLPRSAGGALGGGHRVPASELPPGAGRGGHAPEGAS